MIQAELVTRGNKKFLKEARGRLKGNAPMKAMKNWQTWVKNKRIIQMYQQEGSVRGEQGRWAPLSPWTAEVKGTSRTKGRLISHKGYRFGAMVRSYVIETKRRGLRAFESTITNRARSSSKWSKGFDYPSALHKGWTMTKPITPKKKDGVLAWKTAAGHWHVYKKTSPTGAPAREHIKFFRKDSRKALKTLARWVLRGNPNVPYGD